nr:hypothetical protein [uncultured Dyadobacter sp.]
MKSKSLKFSMYLAGLAALLILPYLAASLWRMYWYTFQNPFQNGLLYHAVMSFFLLLLFYISFGLIKTALNFKRNGFLDKTNVAWLQRIGFVTVLVAVINPVRAMMDTVDFGDPAALSIFMKSLMLDSPPLFLISAFTFLYAEFIGRAIDVKLESDNII